MIRHVWSVLCRSSAVDKDTNSLSLFDVAEELTLLEPIREKGIAPFPLQLVTLWSRRNPAEPARAVARIRLVLPIGEQSGAPSEYQVDLTTFKRLRHRFTTAMFPIVEAGVHEFVIEMQDPNREWVEVARIPMELTVKVPADEEKPG